MEKRELLQIIQQKVAENEISEKEVLEALRSDKNIQHDAGLSKKLTIVEILYYIGGAIVFIGIAVLIFNNWSTLGLYTKIGSTLGMGITTYVTGVLFMQYKHLQSVGQSFFFISALVLPLGLIITFDQFGIDTADSTIQSLISGILLFVFLTSYFLFKRSLFIIFSILYGTWLFFAFTNTLFEQLVDIGKSFQYRFLITGLAYSFLGFSFSKNKLKPLSETLYGFGSLLFLGAALTLGGWKPDQNMFWELLFPGLVFGTMFLSVYLKGKSFLTIGALFLMLYILKITAEYFTDSIGWPLSLVISGFFLIAIGYFTFHLKNKYFNPNKTSPQTPAQTNS